MSKKLQEKNFDVHLRVPPDLAETLQKRAEEEYRSVNSLCLHLISVALQKQQGGDVA